MVQESIGILVNHPYKTNDPILKMKYILLWRPFPTILSGLRNKFSLSTQMILETKNCPTKGLFTWNVKIWYKDDASSNAMDVKKWNQVCIMNDNNLYIINQTTFNK